MKIKWKLNGLSNTLTSLIFIFHVVEYEENKVENTDYEKNISFEISFWL